MKKRTRALFLKVITFFQIFTLTFQPLSLLSLLVLDPVVARAQDEVVLEEQVIAEPVVEAGIQAEPAGDEEAEEIIEHEDTADDLIDIEENLEETPEVTPPVANEEEPGEDDASAEADPILSIPEPTLTLIPTPMPTVAIAPETQELATTCLSPEQEANVTYGNWSIDQEEDSAQSIDKVQLGVEYAFPLDSAVSVSFTCLPEKEEDRSAIKIQRVLVSDLNLPDSVETNALYAYDITTDMSNGSFKYDLTLPKPEGVEAEVVYIEESIEKVMNGVESEDLKIVKKDKIDQKKNSVEVEGLDHFTIFITTYGDPSFLIEKSTYARGETIYVKAGNLDTSRYYKIRLNPNGSGGDVDSSGCFNPNSSADVLTFDYTFPSNARLGSWDAELRGYSNSNCSNNLVTEATDSFAVIATVPAPNPSLPTQACGLDIALVLDVSGSIDDTELRQMKDAFKAFVDALSGTPTQFSVTKFDTTATVLRGFTSDYEAVKAAIESADGSGWTNWEDGLNKAWSTYDPRTDKPNLIIFSSDGNPNRIGTGGTSASETDAVAGAVAVANTIKGAGTRILALGIGSDLNTGNMIAISGTNVNTGILTSDVISTDFATLATDLGDLASKTCGGTITVKKYIDSTSTPGGDGWIYTVSSGSTTKYLETGTDGTANTGKITAGTYSVVETGIPSGYSYGSATCTNKAGATVGSIITNGRGSITVSDEDIISCDFINTRNKGSITIVKNAQPNHAQDFTFTTTGSGLSGFSLDDDADNTLSNTKVFSNLTPGEFTVTENTVSGWNLSSITCNTGETVDLDNRKVTINLTPDENVTCTFVNTLSTGNIIVDKVTEPAGDDTSFSFTTTGSGYNGFSLKDTDSPNNQQLAVGTYSVFEDLLSGWTKKSAVCLSSIGDTETPGNLELDAGETITCTFTNTKKGNLIVQKTTYPSGDSTNFTILASGTGTITGGGSGTISDSVDKTYEVTPGTYSVGETVPSGWRLLSNSCLNIVVGAGETKYCTIVNEKYSKITIVKEALPESSQLFTFTTTGSSLSSFQLKDDGESSNSKTFFNLNSGTYTVKETVPDGWSLTSLVCTDPTGNSGANPTVANQADINLAVGEEVVCTFTNTKYNPQIKVVKSSETTEITAAGQVVPYAFTITNTGDQTLTGITVSDPNCDAAPAYQSGDTNTNSKLDLAEAWIYTCSHTVTQAEIDAGGNLSNTVTVDSNESEEDTDNFDIPVTQNPTLSIVKTASPSTYDSVGDVISYEFKVKNTGNVTLYGISVVDDKATDESCPDTSAGLAPQGEITCTASYTITQGDLDGGSVTNIAYATDGETDSPTDTETVTAIQSPALTIDKTATPSTYNKVGDVISYEFKVKNTGNVTLYGISVVDDKATDESCPDTSAGLAPQGEITCTATYTITQGDLDGGSVTNIAYATDGETDSPTDTETVTAIQSPALTIDKTATPSTYDKVGDVIDYSFVVTNTGNVTLIGPFTVSDDKVANVVCPDTASLAPGDDLICSATYTITLDDLEAESVTNIAFAQGYFGETPVISPEDTETVTSAAGKITVYKYYDLNRDGVKDWNETTLADWEMIMSGDEEEDSIKQSTAESGSTLFYLPAGDWQLSETMQEDWEQTGIYCEYAGEGKLISQPGEGYGCHGHCWGWNNCGDAATCALWACNINGYSNLVSYGKDYPCTQLNTCHLFNYGPGSIEWNWNIFCDVFGVTDIYCSNGNGVPQRLIGYDSNGDVYQNNAYNLTVNPGDKRVCYVGNSLKSQLMIEKTNDAWPNDQEIGDEVTYTIKLMATNGPVYDVSLFDLPPNAFSYVAGSYTADSSITGALSLSEPNYASPGEWQLGDLAKDEIITVSYKAIIGDEADAGIYPDVAWATGTSAEAQYFGEEEADLLALSDPSFTASNEGVDFLGDQGHYGEEHFVGTRVAVVTDETPSAKYKVEKIKEKEGAVLGAILPATGANFWLSLLAILSILTGTGLLLVPNRKRRQGKVLMMLLMLGLGLLMAKPVQALTSVRLAQPYNSSAELDQDAITNQDEFRIDFVILNTDGASLTAQCQQQEDGGAWTNIDTFYTVKAGGNSGYCQAKDLANSSQYVFRVLTDDGKEGQSVKVALETDRPKKPVSYEKHEISSCKYEIKFKTADDGRTSRVEVYRSDDNVSFTAKASSRIKTISIGSDEKHSFETTRPDCDKDYYYAIRAFDQYGNASDLVGDREVKTIIVEGTGEAEEAGAIAVTETVVLDGNIGDAGVLSEGLLGEEVAEDEKGTILGIDTESLVSFLTKVALPILVFVTIAILVYRLVIAKRNEK